MKLDKVCVVGGSGFVGRHIVHLLAAQEKKVRVTTRNRERSKGLIVLPTVDVVQADVHDDAQLEQMLEGMDAVINLVGILHEERSGDFQRVHVELPQRIARTCERLGIPRLVHMSALNADVNGPSAYLRSKGEAEATLKNQTRAPAVTIFRPSVIFGREDKFLNLFAKLLRFFPVLFLACPNARFQPVFVEDVARVFVDSLARLETFGQSYDLCGPKVYTLRELVKYMAVLTGRYRPIVGLSDRLSYLQAWSMEFLPVKLMTRDNYYSMRIDSVCDCAFPEIFGFQPAALEAAVPLYLAGGTPRGRYRWFRYKAGR
ncbi:MAG TPA: complex I NDUFA9 subunit family protein [Burkholderiales bacterium]|nr:complex I NDUFA9 subunit family protein [Burkholderiales bacterium]